MSWRPVQRARRLSNVHDHERLRGIREIERVRPGGGATLNDARPISGVFCEGVSPKNRW
jgi:hypothetical protein